uniref:Gustatory receptor n=1 Tax=Anopheles epiroticus TaxID=199890 RepID=A0A182P329_9DIPT
YRVVELLAIAILYNGTIFHVFFHFYYVNRHYTADKPFLPMYIVCWLFMYMDIAMELVLGLCDCLLLIARLQLDRLVGMVKNHDHTVPIDRLLPFFAKTYDKITEILRNGLTPYFGPLILLQCSYVCLGAAVCLLDANSNMNKKQRRSIMIILANILWPLSDVKKLMAVFLLGESVNGMVAICILDFYSLAVNKNSFDILSIAYIIWPLTDAIKLAVLFLLCEQVNALNHVLSIGGTIWSFVYIVHNVTFCAVMCALPWQAFLHRDRLAAALNTLHENELHLRDLTHRNTDYAVVKLLAIVVLCNGAAFHAFFHTYFISRSISLEKPFLPTYVACLIYMYFDFVIELVLGLCDCLLLIARLQLQRLVWLAKRRDHTVPMDRVLQFYLAIYSRVIYVLRDKLGPYFGLLILLHCSYVCLETAVCILDASTHILAKEYASMMVIIANILWPLSDMRKLAALFLLGEGVNGMKYRFSKMNINFSEGAHCSGISQYEIMAVFDSLHVLIRSLRLRKQLATVMNGLAQNEEDLVELTGGRGSTDYRVVSMLSSICLWNGALFHVFFNYFYIGEFGRDQFVALYIVCCLYLYLDLGMELLLGLCDCLLLIAQLQLERLVWLVKDMQAQGVDPPEGFFFRYEAIYHRTVCVMRTNMSRYFGPVLAVFCVYVSFEVAICVLAVVGDVTSYFGQSKMYDVQQRAYRKPTQLRFAVQFLYALCCASFASFRLWMEFTTRTQIDIDVLENATYIVTTISFSVVWFVVPLYAYRRCSRLVSALNSLLENDADLRHATALSYWRVKCFASCIQFDGVLCCLLLTTGYMVLYWFQGEPWYVFLTVAIYLYEDLCISWLFGCYSTIMLLCVVQLSCAADLLQKAPHGQATALLEERVRLFCATYNRICSGVVQPFYEYCGPIVATFCPVIIFEGSLELFYAYDLFKKHKLGSISTELLVVLLEWLWLLFDLKKLFVVLGVSAVLKQKVSMELLLKASNEGPDTFERVWPLFGKVNDRVTIDVRKGLSEYYGPIVIFVSYMLVMEGAVKIVDIGVGLHEGSGDLVIFALGSLWFLFNFKKFIVLLLFNERFNRQLACMAKLGIRMHLAYMAKIGLSMVIYDQDKQSFCCVQYVRFKFTLLFAVALTSTGYLLWRSPMDYIVYKLDSGIFDVTIFIINTIITCSIYIILPLQYYCRHRQLSESLNALLKNDSILQQLAGVGDDVEPLHYREATCFSRLLRLDGIACLSFFFCCYLIKSWSDENFLHIQLSICIYLAMDLALEWTLGLCCVMMLVCVAQISYVTELLMKASNERANSLEQMWPLAFEVCDRVTIDVCKGLSQYSGPIVALFSALIVLECAITIVDIGIAITDGGGNMALYTIGSLWLVFDLKKFFVPLLLSERLKRQVSVCFLRNSLHIRC